jgi:hypothetical protein
VGEQETDTSRLDRELDELLQELRVSLPGVQVLFAFLLTVPFSQRFESLTSTQRTTYFIAFLGAAAASAFLLAPAAYHRIQWRQRDKEHLLESATKFAIVGLACLAVAIAAAAFVVTDVLYDTAWAAVVAGLVAALLTAVWFMLPIARRLRAQ